MPASGPRTEEPWTIRRVLTWTREKFAGRGIPSARLDAELLLCHCLALPRVALYTRYDQPLDAEELARFRGLIQRRLAGEPVAYLVEQKEFYSLPLRVTRAVLVPRPETELLVETTLRRLDTAGEPSAPVADAAGELIIQYDPVGEAAAAGPSPDEGPEEPAAVQSTALPGIELSYEPIAEAAETQTSESAESPARGGLRKKPARASSEVRTGGVVVDVGTGSGAVALALKHTRPALRVLAIDRSEAALAIAQENAEKLGLQVEFLHGDLLAPLPAGLRCDAIAANLPYIPTGELPRLQPEVRCEPQSALDGGADGLDLIRRLVRQAPERLVPRGALALEVGDDQTERVAELLRAAGFTDVLIEKDLAELPRVVSGRLRG